MQTMYLVKPVFPKILKYLGGTHFNLHSIMQDNKRSILPRSCAWVTCMMVMLDNQSLNPKAELSPQFILGKTAFYSFLSPCFVLNLV